MAKYGVTNTIPASITQATISNDNRNAYSETSITLNFTTVHTIPAGGEFTVIYPSEVIPLNATASTISCSINIALSPVCLVNTTSRTIRVTNAVNQTISPGSRVSLIIRKLVNPQLQNGSSSFTLTTYEVYNSVAYKIDEIGSNLKLSVNCDFPCMTCS